MIWFYTVQFISTIYNTIVDFLGVPIITTLPFGVDAFLLDKVGWINQLGYIFPILDAPWDGFKWFFQGVLVFIGLIVFRILP